MAGHREGAVFSFVNLLGACKGQVPGPDRSESPTEQLLGGGQKIFVGNALPFHGILTQEIEYHTQRSGAGAQPPGAGLHPSPFCSSKNKRDPSVLFVTDYASCPGANIQ